MSSPTLTMGDTLEAEFPMKSLHANGLTFNVLDAGQGEPVLLLHGFPDCHEVWRLQVPELVAAGYRVIVPDLRGCGDSEMGSCVADYHLRYLLADVIAMLDALGLQQVRLVGHDWGAVLGWQLVLAHPQRFLRYVALSVGHPLGYMRGGLPQLARGWYVGMFQLRGVAEWLIRAGGWALFRGLTALPQEFPLWHARLRRPGRLTAGISWYRANLQLLWRKDYAAVQVPVVGIYSECDKFLTRRQMQASAAYCDAGFRYVEVPATGHWMQLEAPQLVTPLILQALKEQQT